MTHEHGIEPRIRGYEKELDFLARVAPEQPETVIIMCANTRKELERDKTLRGRKEETTRLQTALYDIEEGAQRQLGKYHHI